MSQRRPGRVVQIRVTPRDCLSVIDVWDKLGVKIEGASFSQLVSTALASALESFRKNGIIPDRDGTEYSRMMERFPDIKAARARALSINEVMYHHEVPAVVPETLETRRAFSRFKELRLKVDENDPMMEPGQPDWHEYQALLDKYPDFVDRLGR